MNASNKRLIVAALVLLSLYLLTRTVMTAVQASAVLRMAEPGRVGLGKELLSLVETLESRIGARNAHEAKIDIDPLKISRIVRGGSSEAALRQEYRESAGKLRLSCTILSGGRATAIIKFKGESQVLSVGDLIDNKRVTLIDAKRVVLDDNGREMVLFNTPEPIAESKYNPRTRLNDLDL